MGEGKGDGKALDGAFILELGRGGLESWLLEKAELIQHHLSLVLLTLQPHGLLPVLRTHQALSHFKALDLLFPLGGILLSIQSPWLAPFQSSDPSLTITILNESFFSIM